MGNFNFKTSYRDGGVGLVKLLPDEATTKPIIFHSILLFFSLYNHPKDEKPKFNNIKLMKKYDRN
ncbi:MAG: hypothetical protein ACFE9S_01720 [Candidatus Hermodarchaeota archaeon]